MLSRRDVLSGAAGALGLAVLPASTSPAATSPAATSPAGSSPAGSWSDLGSRLQGEVVLPADDGYAVARQLELGQFDAVRPAAVVYCESAADVSLALRFAQQRGLPVAVRSGGHSYGGYSTTPGVLVDVARLHAIGVAGDQVTLGPGTMNVDVLTTLAAQGLAVAGGGCPTVAAGGFVQGGGFGLLTRPYGMACDALVSAEVVLADGRVVAASATSCPDLYWALRGGGGGNFGVVTRYTVKAHQLTTVDVTNLVFPWSAAAAVLDAYTRWLVDAPRTISGGAYVDLPDAAPGTDPTVSVSLVGFGGAQELATQAARLVAVTGAPASRQDANLPYQALMMAIYGCGGLTAEACRRVDKTPTGQLPRPAFGVERSRLFDRPATAAAWQGITRAFQGRAAAGHQRRLEVHAFGGAANDPARTATAYVHRTSLFCVNFRDTIADPAAATASAQSVARAWADDGFAAVDPWSNGESYQNWIDPALTDWRRAYYAENYPRLLAVKAAYDPRRVFSFRQGIGA